MPRTTIRERLQILQRLGEQARDWVWSERGRTCSQHLLARALRITQAVAQRMFSGALPLRAMSLVYTTLLSLVPLLAISFSVLKGLGVHNQFEPFLLNFLAPLGEQGERITGQIIEFVDNIEVGVLGAVGVAFLLYTVIALVQKIEQAFNTIWHIRHPRTLARRFSDYLSVLLVGPVLVFMALGITASLTTTEIAQSVLAVEPFAMLAEWGGRIAPYIFIVLAFSFVYIFIPNTRVRASAALLGGLIAGLAWQLTGWAFASFVAGSARYAAIYSGFAILILFMIWLYLNWLILLLGAQIAFYIQHPHFLRPDDRMAIPVGMEADALALAVMYSVGTAHRAGKTPPAEDELARDLAVSGDALEPILERLRRAGLVLDAGGQRGSPGLYPGRSLDRIPLTDVIDAIRDPLRSASVGDERPGRNTHLPDAVEELTGNLDTAMRETLVDLSLADLLEEEDGKSDLEWS
ncbi:MAG: YhjD/YihY/BrkB family envelope integrity protein [Pseudomonadota bacterium]